jgi:hypothetical protein
MRTLQLEIDKTGRNCEAAWALREVLNLIE